jgi:hypothetical protein
MLDDKESNRLIAEYSSRAREYAEAVTRLRFADEASFLVACSMVQKARAACEQACLLFDEYLGKSRSSSEPDTSLKCRRAAS